MLKYWLLFGSALIYLYSSGVFLIAVLTAQEKTRYQREERDVSSLPRNPEPIKHVSIVDSAAIAQRMLDAGLNRTASSKEDFEELIEELNQEFPEMIWDATFEPGEGWILTVQERRTRLVN